jgi:very-short-patch-repair endonuclease
MRSSDEMQRFCAIRASQMKMAPTPAERLAWDGLQRLGFKRQYVFSVARKRSASARDWYILDFFHPAARLCVELDGAVHRKTRGRDSRRDRAIAIEGIRTIRFPNSAVTQANKRAEFFARIASEVSLAITINSAPSGQCGTTDARGNSALGASQPASLDR